MSSHEARTSPVYWQPARIRQIELDLFADPQGGRFSRPMGIQRASANKLQPPPGPNEAAMNLPGIKVLHIPDFDYQTTVETFSKALEEVRDWSRENPAHVPIFMLLELKDQTAGEGFTHMAAWDEKMMASMEAEILKVFRRDQILSERINRSASPGALRRYCTEPIDHRYHAQRRRHFDYLDGRRIAASRSYHRFICRCAGRCLSLHPACWT
ncbi:MAG: phosphatidylinositol-specific phospholipase C1-like protein [Verrucomicrobiales bacterium]|nr:phosphatidylinositol-specific phospholipase C1-like protein [Verrucomicrobiales bacterium]